MSMSALLLTGDAAPKVVLRRELGGSPPHFRFAGYVPGTYTVFIDAPPFAPRMLRDVKLGEGKTDLGEIAFERGSTVTVRMRTSEGKPAPQVSIQARQNSEPRYVRTQGAGLDALRVRGLAAGHFTIRVTWTDIAAETGYFVERCTEVRRKCDYTPIASNLATSSSWLMSPSRRASSEFMVT